MQARPTSFAAASQLETVRFFPPLIPAQAPIPSEGQSFWHNSCDYSVVGAWRKFALEVRSFNEANASPEVNEANAEGMLRKAEP
jgi:hypothetical protein